MDAGSLGDWPRRLQCDGKEAKYETLGGKPFGFIGAMDARKPTVRLDLCAYHDPPQRPATGSAHAIFIRSLGKLVGHFAFPDGS